MGDGKSMMLRIDEKMGNTRMQMIWALRNRDRREAGKEERARKGGANREGKRREEKIRALDEYEYRRRLHNTRKERKDQRGNSFLQHLFYSMWTGSKSNKREKNE